MAIAELAGQIGSAGIGAGVGMGMSMLDEAMFGEKRKRDQIEQQQKMTDMATAQSMKIMEQQRNHQMQTWRDTNYSAQMEEMRKAGLNPAMMYAGGGEGGSTASVAGGMGSSGKASDEASMAEAQTKKMGMGLEMAMMEAQVENLKANTEKQKAEAEFTGGAKTEEAVANIGLKNMQEAIMDEQRGVNLRRLGIEADKATNELEILINDKDISNETKDAQIKSYVLGVEEIIVNMIEKESRAKLNDEQRMAVKENLIIAHINAQSGRMNAEKIGIGQVIGKFIEGTKIPKEINEVLNDVLPWRGGIGTKIWEVVKDVGAGVGRRWDAIPYEDGKYHSEKKREERQGK